MTIDGVDAASDPMPIDVIADVVCPWCWVGKRRLDEALQMRPDLASGVVVRWRPYLLNPWVPEEGMPRDEYLRAKFGSYDRAPDYGRIAEIGRDVGLEFHFDRIERQPSTLKAHRLIIWARREGLDTAVYERICRAYFSEGAYIGSIDVLVGLATECGLDPDATRRMLESNAEADRAAREAERAREAGINGVPFYAIGSVLGISGAQEPTTLILAIEEAQRRRAAIREERRAAL